MSGEWASAALALGLVAAPSAVRVAQVSSEGDKSTDERCIAADNVAVERQLGGAKDVAIRLSRGTRVTVLGLSDELVKIRYPFKHGSRVGWVAPAELGECAGEIASKPEPKAPAPKEKALAAAEEHAATHASLHPFGAPVGAVQGGVVLRKSAYDCYYDPALKYCRWVGYCFAPTGQTSARYGGGFFPEPSLASGERAENDDYSGAYKKDLSGFDKGHMAPDGTIKAFGKDAQKETYSLANITPQYSRMNQGIWRELEDSIRKWATASEPVCVETGPVFEKGRAVERLKGPNKLAIPHAYYAIVTQGSSPSALSFVVPNEPERESIADVMTHAASIDDIEALVGFDFLAELKDAVETPLEATLPEEFWN